MSRTVVVLVVGAAGATGACTNPEIEARQWDEIQSVASVATELRAYANELQVMVDSLHKLVQRQDSAIRLLVDFTGAQVPGYRAQAP